ncbi:sensor histidine kinase [Nonomuraea cavernae]|uniref:sensor histidine kinase n=1 Tax=Nonomuraea cavernae TaxID=2045107 RepID=UPI0033E8A78A
MARPEKARRFLLYWMDGAVALLALSLSGLVVRLGVEGRLSVPHALAAEACLLGVLVPLPFLLRAAYDNRPRPTARLVLSGMAALGAVLLVPPSSNDVLGEGSWSMVAFLWLSAAVLFQPLWAALCMSAAVIVLTSAVVTVITGQPWQVVLPVQAFTAGVMVVAMWLWRWLWWTIRDAHESQEAKAGLAVAEERLRFARDLHDLLGHSLSVITLKSELAAKLATKDPGRAAREMADVRRLAGESLTEVQLAVDGYQGIDLHEELDGVCAALEAAGTRCTVEAGADDLSPGARALLAWVVREGATNVLKHSTATRCAIVIDGGVLEMRNDGVHGSPAAGGTGLRGLSERLAAVGGSLSAGPTSTGEFLLRAAVPA